MNASTSPRLDVIQRWMQSVIVHSEGVEAGIESAAAQGMIAVRPGQIEELICRSRGQSSIERLEVYSNAYRARLLEVLIGEYPALVEALGEEAFVGLASGYLDVLTKRGNTRIMNGFKINECLAVGSCIAKRFWHGYDTVYEKNVLYVNGARGITYHIYGVPSSLNVEHMIEES